MSVILFSWHPSSTCSSFWLSRLLSFVLFPKPFIVPLWYSLEIYVSELNVKTSTQLLKILIFVSLKTYLLFYGNYYSWYIKHHMYLLYHRVSDCLSFWHIDVLALPAVYSKIYPIASGTFSSITFTFCCTWPDVLSCLISSSLYRSFNYNWL